MKGLFKNILGAVCRDLTQYPAFAPGTSEVAAGFWSFLYLVNNLPQLLMQAVVFSPLQFLCSLLLEETFVQVQALQLRVPGLSLSQLGLSDGQLSSRSLARVTTQNKRCFAGVLGALCQELGSETYTYIIISHTYALVHTPAPCPLSGRQQGGEVSLWYGVISSVELSGHTLAITGPWCAS